MLSVIESFKIDPNDWDFVTLAQAEQTHSESFLIQDKLRINFEQGEGRRVALSAMLPKVSAPHYRIHPIDMGASAWYSIECEIAGDLLKDVDQLIPYLDAASAQSVMLFAVLRIFHADGRSEDISSSQIELRRNRSKQTFPISLGDLPNLDTHTITSGRLIFFIEARNVDIDLYGMTVATVSTQEAEYTTDHVKLLRAAHEAGTQSLQMLGLNPNRKNLWTGKAREHRPIVPDVFLDFQPGDGRKMTVSRDGNSLNVDFSHTESGGWRNLEFRFDKVENSGSIYALIHTKGRASVENGYKASLFLREYDENFAWQDTPISGPLRLFPADQSALRLIDLSPILSDKRDIHRFGLMVFLPPETRELKIEEMEVFVFDRELV